jgi:hypothetical protein
MCWIDERQHLLPNKTPRPDVQADGGNSVLRQDLRPVTSCFGARTLTLTALLPLPTKPPNKPVVLPFTSYQTFNEARAPFRRQISPSSLRRKPSVSSS